MSGESTPLSSISQSSSTPSSPPRTPPNLHQNTIDPSAKWLVQKFGGTSVGKFAVKIAEDIVSFVKFFFSFYSRCSSGICNRNYIDQHKVAIVCSARSGSTKALGTTNLLLRSASQTLQRRRKSSAPSGTTTPVTRGLFGAGYDGSQSPPRSPQPRGRLTPNSSPQNFTGLTLTPLTVPQVGHAQPEFNVTVDIIREEHLKAANASVRDPDILEELVEEIENDCDWLRNFLFAAQVCLVNSD